MMVCKKRWRINRQKPTAREINAYAQIKRIGTERMDQNGRPVKTSWACGAAFDQCSEVLAGRRTKLCRYKDMPIIAYIELVLNSTNGMTTAPKNLNKPVESATIKPIRMNIP